MSTLTISIQHCIAYFSQCIEEVEGMGLEISVFTDDMIVYIGLMYLIKPTKINVNLAIWHGIQINLQKSILFL